jgi:DNA-binding beta-propeller fold protein YncE
MKRHVTLGLAAVLMLSGASLAGVQPIGGTLPPPASGSFATLLATDSLGGIYACDGNALYKFSGGTFGAVYTGIGGAAGAGSDPAGLAVTPDGRLAYVATGMSGALVEIDLSAHTARSLAAAGLGNGNYGVAVDPIYGQVFVTSSWTAGANAAQSLYLVDPTKNGALTLLDDFGKTSVAGGGIAFSPQGELIVPVPTSFSAWPTDDSFMVDLYRFSRSWLDNLHAGTVVTGAGQKYASNVTVSGSGTVAVDTQGTAYLVAADAIYAIDPSGNRRVAAGNESDNAWDMWGYGFTALAYDLPGNRLITGYSPPTGTAYALSAVAAPEPATLALFALGAAGLLGRRQKR